MTKSTRGHLYSLAATDYFSKWAEVVPLKEVKKENVAHFICTSIIYRYGVPSLLKKVVVKSKRDWHERIGEALWAYRTTVRMPTQSTPYVLVYRVDVVLPLEQQIPSLRITIQGLTEKKNARILLEELEAQQGLARLFKASNKKVYLHSFQVGDLSTCSEEAYNHNSSNEKQIVAQMGWSVCCQRSLYKWCL
ncbi:UNVERIFIED_CONTAM: hypothetical protein Slati_0502600 [Sesamum latifolium]